MGSTIGVQAREAHTLGLSATIKIRVCSSPNANHFEELAIIKMNYCTKMRIKVIHNMFKLV